MESSEFFFFVAQLKVTIFTFEKPSRFHHPEKRSAEFPGEFF